MRHLLLLGTMALLLSEGEFVSKSCDGKTSSRADCSICFYRQAFGEYLWPEKWHCRMLTMVQIR